MDIGVPTKILALKILSYSITQCNTSVIHENLSTKLLNSSLHKNLTLKILGYIYGIL